MLSHILYNNDLFFRTIGFLIFKKSKSIYNHCYKNAQKSIRYPLYNVSQSAARAIPGS